MTSHKPLLATLLVLAASGCSDSDSSSSDAESEPRMQVILDYSPTLSDAGALLYLASNPAVELLAVTLPGTGEADCEPGVRTTRSLLTVAERDAVPIGCGRNTPLVGNRDWPEEWRTEVNRWGNDMLPTVGTEPLVDAEQLLADTLRSATAPVTLVVVGPLTNVGVVLGDHPELADHIERIVIMGGAVTVPGNVEASPAAEWNIYIDPEAARRVIASGVAITFVPLDATNHVPWTERLVARLAELESAAARTVHDLATSRASLEGLFMWDELAAMVAVDPQLATLESMTVRIDDNGATVRDPAGVSVDVAIDADADAAMDEFVATLNGGTAPEVKTLTAAELDYFVQMGGVDSDFGIALNRVFAGIDEDNPDVRGMATSVVTGFISAADELLVRLRDMEPPSSLREVHAAYVEALSTFVAQSDGLQAAVATAEGTDVNEVLDNALAQSSVGDIFEGINATCEDLVQYSFVRGGPRPC